MTEQAERVDEGASRVVVGVDGSTGARAALRFALEDAARRGVDVDAVAAYRPPETWMDFYVAGDYQHDRAERAAAEQAEAFVAEVLREVPQPAPQVRVRAVLGAAADVLIRESADADLLVVGSRGHGGFSSMLLGSVSMQCALHATCPVTVVHSSEAHRARLRQREEGAPDDRTAVG
ncbi:universal stress protein [Geodermatophilus sp. TF02-6]|uniref:universal stress protein n=1 Tax=Geodermatophilus sp. TF02-6 TaxID=2250575 RepID=UPI000DEA0716|nr:universal stress protein [Geodermatophilus sp. TF02-6]RBY78886.1 universal stress protein [Geodermatophilus sp. TF02-6]